MSWRHFGDLRSALVDHDWRTVAWLMDLEGGCEDERARRYAYDALMRLRPEHRPFRIAVGAGKVCRKSLRSVDSVDVWKAMQRRGTNGPSFVLAPLYGTSSDEEHICSNPTAMRPVMVQARLDLINSLYRQAKVVRGRDTAQMMAASMRLDVLGAIKGELERSCKRNYHHALFRALSAIVRHGHPRVTIVQKVVMIDSSPANLASIPSLLLDVVGEAGAVAASVEVIGGWMEYDLDAAAPLIEHGHMRAHLLRAAGVWPVPSPVKGGQPEGHATTNQVSLLDVAAQDDGQMTLLAGA
jgi:hypothetical protein